MSIQPATRTTVLDVRDLPPRERHPKIFQLFAQLAEGEGFVLVNDHDPKPLLYQFQFEHANRFEWWPLEEGPEAWRIHIAKRGAADGERTFTDFLQTDHARLDAIYTQFRQDLAAGRRDAAAGAFGEFAVGLRRHIRMEEEHLFPAVEPHTGGPGGPTGVMRMEHEQIQELLAVIEAALAGPASASPPDDRLRRAAAQLPQVLVQHNQKEEQILYPLSDRAYGASERTDLIRRMQAS